MTTKELFAVRAEFNDPSGTYGHEEIYGYGPTVFTDRQTAVELESELDATADKLDWGDNNRPAYYVEPINRADLWPAEEVCGEVTA